MKKKFMKFITVLLVVVTLTSVFMPPVYADLVNDILNSVISLFTYPVRRLAIAIGAAVDSLVADVAYIDGKTAGNEFTSQSMITPFDILYNKVLILDINFFDINAVSPVRNPLAYQVRLGLATWFYILRIIAVVVLFVILVYVGIRMALSTVASERTKYKKMITDWVVSLVLVFLVQYIMIFTITVNNALVNGLSVVVQSGKIQGVYESIKNTAMELTDPNSNAAAVVYVMLVFQTFGLLCSYFNRMLKCAFLTIISPLITITYSIDRMGDGKAQAFGAWTKEYVYTVLIQPFHCMIYMVFVNTAFDLLKEVKPTSRIDTLAIAVIAIICLRFVKDAENILRQIFQFKNDAQDSSLGNALTVGASAYAITKNLGTNTKNVINSTRELKTSITSGLAAAELNKRALKIYRDENKGKDEEHQISYEEAREEARADMDAEIADKLEEKLGRPIDQTSIDARVEEIKKQTGLVDNPNMSDTDKEKLKRRLQSRAKRDIAEKYKMDKKERSPGGKISGFAREVRGVYNNSSVLKGAAKIAKGYAGAGVGMFAMGGLASNSDASAIVAGTIAASKMTTDFLSSSVGTAASQAEDIAKASGVKNQIEMAEYAAEAYAECGDEVTEQTNADAIMTDIQNALMAAGLNDSSKAKKIAKSIRNNIKRAAPNARSPETLTRVKDHALNNAIQQYGVSEELADSIRQSSDVASAISSMASHENKAAFVKSVRNGAQSTAISEDTLVGTIIGRQSGRLRPDDEVAKIVAIGGGASSFESGDDYTSKTAEYDAVMGREGFSFDTLAAIDENGRTGRRKKVDKIDEQLAEDERRIEELEREREFEEKQIQELTEDHSIGIDPEERARAIEECRSRIKEAQDEIESIKKSDTKLEAQRAKLVEDASKLISDKQFEELGRQMANIDEQAGEAQRRLFEMYHRKAEAVVRELEARVASMNSSIESMKKTLDEGIVADPDTELSLRASVEAMQTTKEIEEARLGRHQHTLDIFNGDAPKETYK